MIVHPADQLIVHYILICLELDSNVVGLAHRQFRVLERFERETKKKENTFEKGMEHNKEEKEDHNILIVPKEMRSACWRYFGFAANESEEKRLKEQEVQLVEQQEEIITLRNDSHSNDEIIKNIKDVLKSLRSEIDKIELKNEI